MKEAKEDTVLKSAGQKHYYSIDGLRALSCLGIIAMHIQANTRYSLQGNFIFDRFIPSLTWLVYLFLMISGFGMCSGYLEKFQNGSVDMEEYVKKRYLKILPFYAFLLIIAIVIEHTVQAVYEVSIEVLLLHGLLPNNEISVIGVSWTLGVIFLFYLLFPVISILFKRRRRAWAGIIIALWISFVCEKHFFTEYFVTKSFAPRHSFIYCIPFFIGGGLIYLYREKISDICAKFGGGILGICIAATVIWFVIPGIGNIVFYLKSLILFGLWLSYAVGTDSRFLACKTMRFLSGISMEMYLAQMVIFRAVEKLHLLYVFGDSGVGGWLSILLAFLLTVTGLIIFIQCYKTAYKMIRQKCIHGGRTFRRFNRE